MGRILAVDDNLINLKVVTATLTQVGYEVLNAENGFQALAMAAEFHPDLIILDISMPEMDGYEVCRRLRANSATAMIPIMILTAHDTLEEKIKGFEVGADDYLTTPFQRVELQARVKVLLRRHQVLALKEGPPAVQGQVISVISLRGGVGVSTLSTNLAIALAQIWKQPVALVDLVLRMGQAALMLNLSLRHTWADLCQIPLHEMDPEVIQNMMLSHPSGVNVLAAPRRYEEGELVTPEMVSCVLDLMRQHFPYLVLDMPHDLGESTLAGLDISDRIVAPMTPDLASVRAMAGMLEVFDTLHYPREKVQVVMNWTFERRGLARKDIENVLKHPVSMVIPFGAETFVPAINLGVPPTINAVNGPFAALFEDLAYSLSKEEDQQTVPEDPSEAYQRLSARLKLRDGKR